MEIYSKSSWLRKMLSYTLGSANSLNNLGVIALPHRNSAPSQSVLIRLSSLPCELSLLSIITQANDKLRLLFFCQIQFFLLSFTSPTLSVSTSSCFESVLQTVAFWSKGCCFKKAVDGIPRYCHYFAWFAFSLKICSLLVKINREDLDKKKKQKQHLYI